MIASEYLDYRARLDATMVSLAEAARRCGADSGRPALLRNLAAALKDPFLLVVAGESGAGKSMFLNALAAEDFCDASGGEVAYFKFGDQPRDVPAGTGLVESYRPCRFLRDFNVVELPAAGAAAPGAAEAAGRFVPMADLVLVVISVADAWTRGAWRSLDHVHLGAGKETLVALTGCDLRSPDEIRAVVEHMELTMARRYGAPLPIFQMSAEIAFLARTNPAGGGAEKLARSGLPEFERFVSNKLLADNPRAGKFEAVLLAARSLLGDLAPPLAATEEILGGDSDLLEWLKGEINTRYEGTDRVVRSEFFELLDHGHAAAVEAAQAHLAAATGWASLPGQVAGGGRRPPAGLDKGFRDGIVAAVEACAIGAIARLEADVGDLWETLSARVAEVFDHRLSAADATGRALWSDRGEHLLRRAEACAEKACADCSLEGAVAAPLRRGAMTLRFFAAAALLLATAGGVLQALSFAPFQLLVGGLAVVAIGFGAGQSIDGRRKLKDALAARAEAGRIQLRADLSKELHSHVHDYYTRLGSIFDPVQELCQQQIDRVAPQIAAVRGLELDVAGLSDELVAMRAAAAEQLGKAGSRQSRSA